MSELWLARLTKSRKSPVLLDAGAFSDIKMSELHPHFLEKQRKQGGLQEIQCTKAYEMIGNAERPASSRPRIG